MKLTTKWNGVLWLQLLYYFLQVTNFISLSLRQICQEMGICVFILIDLSNFLWTILSCLRTCRKGNFEVPRFLKMIHLVLEAKLFFWNYIYIICFKFKFWSLRSMSYRIKVKCLVFGGLWTKLKVPMIWRFSYCTVISYTLKVTSIFLKIFVNIYQLDGF